MEEEEGNSNRTDTKPSPRHWQGDGASGRQANTRRGRERDCSKSRTPLESGQRCSGKVENHRVSKAARKKQATHEEARTSVCARSNRGRDGSRCRSKARTGWIRRPAWPGGVAP